VATDNIQALIAEHALLIEAGNHYAYFELAYTRSTGWMAWLCSNSKEADPDRKVIAQGQGNTAEAACGAALVCIRNKHSSGGGYYIAEL
jgi:hypothetical protein